MSYFNPDGSINSAAIEQHRKACEEADKVCLYHPSSQEEARQHCQARRLALRKREELEMSIVEKAIEFRNNDYVLFCDDEEVNRKTREHFVTYPHLYVLCCLMDKQIDAAKAWRIPYTVCEYFGTYDIFELNRISLDRYLNIFNDRKLHRFNDSMASVFKSALERIVTQYDGRASMIWESNPSSATVVARFLEFDGCGVKIATMATNLLHRALSVNYSDYSSVDISPDVHIMRVMNRLGLLPDKRIDDRTFAIYRAREINPEYPGILDGLFWSVGKNYCRPSNPACHACSLNSVCNHYRTNRI